MEIRESSVSIASIKCRLQDACLKTCEADFRKNKINKVHHYITLNPDFEYRHPHNVTGKAHLAITFNKKGI